MSDKKPPEFSIQFRTMSDEEARRFRADLKSGKIVDFEANVQMPEDALPIPSFGDRDQPGAN